MNSRKFNRRLLLYAVLYLVIPCLMNAYSIPNHKYILQQAWELLCEQYPDAAASRMAEYLGNNESARWSGFMIAGVKGEDLYPETAPLFSVDDVYGYTVGGVNMPAMAHFWNADPPGGGDDHEWQYLVGTYKNSYQKSKVYAYGESPGIHSMPIAVYIDGDRWDNIQIEYSSLIDLCNTGQYVPISGRKEYVQYHDWPLTEVRSLPANLRYKVPYEILGRLCHLIEDQTVPPHTHNDSHVELLGDGSAFEVYAGNNYGDVDWITALNQGGIFTEVAEMQNPIRFLVYMSNQVGDYFPSEPEDGGGSFFNGDDNYDAVYGSDYYESLETIMDELSTVQNSEVDPPVELWYCETCAASDQFGSFDLNK